MLIFSAMPFFAQKHTAEDYIKIYSETAVQKMIKFGIPASITLAQGIHESNCGNSFLAKEGNNHFGIKCHTSWTGEKIYRDDDTKNECFRKYKNANESFQDHSVFLRNNKRYAFLFNIDVKDYKAWAEGLKTAGYATNPKYSQLIIETIEKYKLNIYDEGIVPEKHIAKKEKDDDEIPSEINIIKIKREILSNNRTDYVIIKKDDTFYKLAEELDLTIHYLHKCNDMKDGEALKEGQIFYIEKKRNRAEREKKTHIVKKGETLHSISQLYAVKLKKLFLRNRMKYGESVQPGDTLWLKSKKTL